MATLSFAFKWMEVENTILTENVEQQKNMKHMYYSLIVMWLLGKRLVIPTIQWTNYEDQAERRPNCGSFSPT